MTENNELKRYDLKDYLWREYVFYNPNNSSQVIYRIDFPVAFYWYSGATTHRVLDKNGIVHLVPAPGQHGCVVRYAKENGTDPVLF